MRPGVHRVVATAAELRPVLADAGWQVLTLDAGTRTGLYEQLARALGRPLGASLDALWDVLRDVETPLVLLWEGWSEVAADDPRWFTRLIDVLDLRAEQDGPPVALLLL